MLKLKPTFVLALSLLALSAPLALAIVPPPPEYASHFSQTALAGIFEKFGFNTTAASHVDLFVSSNEDYFLYVSSQYTITTESSGRGRSTWFGTCDFSLYGDYLTGSGLDSISVTIDLASGSETLHLEVTHETYPWLDQGEAWSWEEISADIVLDSGSHHYGVSKNSTLAFLEWDVTWRHFTAVVNFDGEFESVGYSHWRFALDDSTTVLNQVSANLNGNQVAEIRYLESFSPDDEVHALFGQYDLTRNGQDFKLGPQGGYLRSIRVSDDLYRLEFALQLEELSTGEMITARVMGEQALTRPSGYDKNSSREEGDGGWSWKEFGEACIAAAASGAGGGAVAGSVATDGAAPIGALAGASLGAAGGLAAGALHYTAKRWYQFFFDDFDQGSNLAWQDFYTETTAAGFRDVSSMSQVAYVVPVAAEELPVPALKLDQNTPNPFNPKTTISFQVSEPGSVALEVFDSGGRKISTLVDDQLAPGRYSAVWEGLDQDGLAMSSGVYFYRLTADGQQQARRMLLLK